MYRDRKNVQVYDLSTGMKETLGIGSIILGPSKGGIRMHL
jgi:hypothetical protein